MSFDGNLLVSGKTTCACLFVGRKPNWRLFLEEKLTGGTCVRKHKENNTLRGWPRETKSDCFASLVCQVSKPAIKWCETTGMGPCFFLTPPSNSMGPGGWAPQPKLFSGSKRRKAKAGGVAYKPRSERKPSKLVGHPRKAQHQAGLTICRPCAGFLEVLAKETQRNQFRTRGKHENWFWSQETSERTREARQLPHFSPRRKRPRLPAQPVVLRSKALEVRPGLTRRPMDLDNTSLDTLVTVLVGADWWFG